MPIFASPGGSFILQAGNVIIALGVVIAAWVLVQTVRDEEVSLKFLSDHFGLLVVIPLIFGRIGALAVNWSLLSTTFEPGVIGTITGVIRSFFLVGTGGIQLDWAFFGLMITFVILALWRREKAWVWLDVFTLPAVVVLIAFSFGSHLNGWGYGSLAPEWLPWPLSVEYEQMNVRYLGSIYAVQLYATVLYTLLFIFGWRLWKRKIYRRWPAGRFTGVMLLCMTMIGTFLSLFKGEQLFKILGFSVNQAIGFVMIIIIATILLMRNQRWVMDTLHIPNK